MSCRIINEFVLRWSFKDRSYPQGVWPLSPAWLVSDPPEGSQEACTCRNSLLRARHRPGHGSLLCVSPLAKWWEQLGASGSISTLRVSLRGGNVICKFWGMEHALPKCHYDVPTHPRVSEESYGHLLFSFCLFPHAVHSCKGEGWRNARSSSHGHCPRQTGRPAAAASVPFALSQTVARLSWNNHMLRAAVHQKTRIAVTTFVDKMIPEDRDRTTSCGASTPLGSSLSQLTGNMSTPRQGGSVPQGESGVGFLEHWNMNEWRCG